MSTRNVRLEEDVYERIKSEKRPDETFSETVDRLIEGRSLLDPAGILTDEEADEFRRAITESNEADTGTPNDFDRIPEVEVREYWDDERCVPFLPPEATPIRVERGSGLPDLNGGQADLQSAALPS